MALLKYEVRTTWSFLHWTPKQGKEWRPLRPRLGTLRLPWCSRACHLWNGSSFRGKKKGAAILVMALVDMFFKEEIRKEVEAKQSQAWKETRRQDKELPRYTEKKDIIKPQKAWWFLCKKSLRLLTGFLMSHCTIANLHNPYKLGIRRQFLAPFLI